VRFNQNKNVYWKRKRKPFNRKELAGIVKETLSKVRDFSEKKVFVVIPDTTHSGPTALCMKDGATDSLKLQKAIEGQSIKIFLSSRPSGTIPNILPI